MQNLEKNYFKKGINNDIREGTKKYNFQRRIVGICEKCRPLRLRKKFRKIINRSGQDESITVHPPPVYNSAHRVEAQIVQHGPDRDHGEEHIPGSNNITFIK
jgi:hypothetical protein